MGSNKIGMIRKHKKLWYLQVAIAVWAVLLSCGDNAVIAAEPATNRQLEELVKTIKKNGTSIVYKDCTNSKRQGIYQFQTDKKSGRVLLDQITVCTNNLDITNDRRLWEVLVHEGTHSVQLCYEDNTLFEPQEHPSMLREIKKFAPHYAEILKQDYVGHKGGPSEIEAFWMELQDPSYAIKQIGRGCPQQNSQSQANSQTQMTPASGSNNQETITTKRATIVGASAAAICHTRKGLMTKEKANEILVEIANEKGIASWLAANRKKVDQGGLSLQWAMDSKCGFKEGIPDEELALKILKYISD